MPYSVDSVLELPLPNVTYPYSSALGGSTLFEHEVNKHANAVISTANINNIFFLIIITPLPNKIISSLI